MSHNVPKTNQKARLQYIEEHLLFETHEEMATACNVNRKTIERDLTKWKLSGGFDKFLEQEFFQLYSKEKLTNPSRALDRIVTLMIRRVPDSETKEAPNKLVIEIVDPESPNKIQTP
jgi:hypothetical protein